MQAKAGYVEAAWCSGDFLVDLSVQAAGGQDTLSPPVDAQTAGAWLDALVPNVIAGIVAMDPYAFPVHYSAT